MLKSAVLSGCVIAICSSLVDFSIIHEKQRKQIMSILALILIITVASKLLHLDSDRIASELAGSYTNSFSQKNEVFAISKAVEQGTTYKLKEYLCNGLSRLGIIPLDVRIELDVSEDKLITVKKTIVVLNTADKSYVEDVKEYVQEELMQGEVLVETEECDAQGD